MADLPETPSWESGVHQLEETERAKAGPGGVLNVQANQLANRTQYLKEQLDAYNGLIKSGELPFTDLATAQTAINNGKIPEGASFSIRSDNDDAWAVEYKNVNGVATPVIDSTGKQKKYPSSTAINALINNDNVGPAIAINMSNIPTFAQDENGEVYIPGFSRSIQKTISPLVTEIDLFNILKFTDKDKNVMGAMDALGHMRLPDMAKSIQAQAKQFEQRILTLESRRQSYNALEYGLKSKIGYGYYNSVYLQRLADYLTTLPYGGTIYVPEGRFEQSIAFIPRNNVNIIGAGMGKTVFAPMTSNSSFLYYNATQGDPGTASYLTNCLFCDFTIDGQNQPLTATGYSSSIKGMYFQFFSRIFIQRVEICNTGATGLGIDFALNSSITDCILMGNGRLANVGDPGASGIGIGTGGALSEPLFIGGNVCGVNKNFGIFCEHQGRNDSPYTSRNTIVSGNNCFGNNAGLGDCGLDGLIAVGNNLSDNTGYGFLLSRGTVPAAFAGKNGIFNSNQVCRNGSDGISFDVSLANSGGYYDLGNNGISDNAGNGIRLQGGGNRTIQGITLSGNVIARNGYHGILAGGAILNTVFIKNNSLLSNGGNGMLFDGGSFTAGRIFGNELYSNQQYGVAGSSAFTNIDISENHFLANVVGAANLTGAQASVTTGRNPGWSV